MRDGQFSGPSSQLHERILYSPCPSQEHAVEEESKVKYSKVNRIVSKTEKLLFGRPFMSEWEGERKKQRPSFL